jgi:hypothetical protein
VGPVSAFRNSTAVGLVLLGALLCFPASLALWEQRTLAKEQPFVELGRDIIDEPPVQSAIARAVADQVRGVSAVRQVEQQTRLNVDTLAQTGVTALIQSDEDDVALRGVYHTTRALAGIEKDNVQRSGDDLVIDLRPTVRRVFDDLVSDVPALQGFQLPDNVGVVKITNAKNAGVALDAWRDVDTAAPYLILLPLLPFILALFVASGRGFTLFLIGAVIAAGAALRIFMLRGPLDSLLEDVITGDSVYGDAGFAVYGSIVDSYAHQEMMVLYAGVAVAVLGLGVSILSRR